MPYQRTSRFAILGLLCLLGGGDSGMIDTQQNRVPGTGMLSGQGTAPTAFQATRVYATNVDVDIIYMVYTGEGRYQTVAMLPGNYEVWVEKPGFESDRREIEVEAGSALNLDFSLREAPPQAAGQGSFLGLDRVDKAKDAMLLPYDELYPDSPVKSLMEATCIQCHGQSFIAFFHRSTEEWDDTIGRMMQNRIPPGTISAHQRQELAEYLGAYFGSDSPDRHLKMAVELPLDEAVLSKAQYVEYLIPLDEERPRPTPWVGWIPAPEMWRSGHCPIRRPTLTA